MKFKHKRTEYKIEIDEFQYILSRKTVPRKNKEDRGINWVTLGYYNDVNYLLLKLLRLGLVETSDYADIKEMFKTGLKDLNKTLVNLIGTPNGYKEAYERARKEILKGRALQSSKT